MSSKKQRKQLRRESAAAENERRYQDALASSPLSRADLDALLDYVADRIAEGGYGKNFDHTTAWLRQNNHPVEATLDFLRSHRMTDDWEVLIEGDPCKLFGPTATHVSRMPIPREAFEAMIAYVEECVQRSGCDNTRRLTREWLSREGWPVHPTEFALLAQGGGCDCEVVMNVEAENIYIAGSH